MADHSARTSPARKRSSCPGETYVAPAHSAGGKTRNCTAGTVSAAKWSFAAVRGVFHVVGTENLERATIRWVATWGLRRASRRLATVRDGMKGKGT